MTEVDKEAVIESSDQGGRDGPRCYACNGRCDSGNGTQRNICNLCISAYDGHLDEEGYLKSPIRLREDENVDDFPVCDACGKHRREVWNDFVCEDCWGLLRTYRYSYGVCKECMGCPNLEMYV